MLKLNQLTTLFMLTSLFSCSDNTKVENPAQAQIEEYQKKLAICEQERQQLIKNQEQQNHVKASDDNTSKIDNTENKDVTSNQNSPIEQGKENATQTLSEPQASESNLENNNHTDNKLDNKDNINIISLENDIILNQDPNIDTKVVVIEYFSPTCPHCAYFKKEILPKLKTKYIDTNKIKYVMREFISNKQDLDAAILARCKRNTEHFLKFMNIILQQQESWIANKDYINILTNIGTLGGISKDEYNNCLNDEKIMQILINNTKLVSKISSFIGTPAFFINGLQFNGYYNFEELSKAIESALK